MKLTVIGCTGSMSGPASSASSYLLQTSHNGREYSLVLDLGPGSFGNLWRVLDPRQIDGVLASHYHADHFADIISMQVFRRWYPSGALGPIPLWGPAGGHERIRQIEGADEHVDYAGEFTIGQMSDGGICQIGPFQISFYATWHTVESYAIRVSDGKSTIVYSGDTDLCDGLINAAHGADLLLSECAFTAADIAPAGIHMTGERVAQVAARAGVKRVALTHIQPWSNPADCVHEARAALTSSLSLGADYSAVSIPIAADFDPDQVEIFAVTAAEVIEV